MWEKLRWPGILWLDQLLHLAKPAIFCPICHKDVSVLPHGPNEVLCHFQESEQFPRDHRLRLETPGWRLLDYEENSMTANEVKQRDFILRSLLVVWDGKYPYVEVIIDSSVAQDAMLPVLAKVSSLMEVMTLGGSYELVYQLVVGWTLILLGPALRWWLLISLFQIFTYPCASAFWCYLSVNNFEWVVPRILSLGRSMPTWLCIKDSEERGVETWLLVWTGEKAKISSVCLAVVSRFGSNISVEATILGRILDAACLDVSIVSVHGRPHVLVEVFSSYVCSGYGSGLVEYPLFNLRLIKRCLQRTAETVLGSRYPFSKTKFVINCPKGVETRFWITSRHALRKAIITNDLSILLLVDAVEIIFWVWPLVVSY